MHNKHLNRTINLTKWIGNIKKKPTNIRPGFQKYFTHLKYATILSKKHAAKGYESAVIQLSIDLILLRSIQSTGGSY